MLFSIGMDIESRLSHNQTNAPEDEKIDQDLSHLISSLIVSNGVYVHHFKSVRNMSDDMERSRRSFMKLSQHTIATPGNLLSQLAAARGEIYDERTGAMVNRLAVGLKEQKENTAGIVALEIGTLRGSFRAMASEILKFIYKNFSDAIKSEGSDFIKTKIRDNIRQALAEGGIVRSAIQ